METTEVVAIVTLVSASLTLFVQLLQSYLDYKRDLLNKHDDLYKPNHHYNCNCCVVIEENSE